MEDEGGSNLIVTNALSSTWIAMADYDMEAYVYHELNYEWACLAREVCDGVTVIKDITNISPSVGDPFDELVETYLEQIVGLVDGGSDILTALWMPRRQHCTMGLDNYWISAVLICIRELYWIILNVRYRDRLVRHCMLLWDMRSPFA